MRAILIASIVSTGLAGCAHEMGQDVASISREGVNLVPSGREVTLPKTYMTMDKQCRLKPTPTLTVVQQPAYGRAWPTTGTSQPSYGPGPYQHCNDRTATGAAIRYQAAANYRGRDSFTVRVRFENGETHVERVPVEVR